MFFARWTTSLQDREKKNKPQKPHPLMSCRRQSTRTLCFCSWDRCMFHGDHMHRHPIYVIAVCFSRAPSKFLHFQRTSEFLLERDKFKVKNSVLGWRQLNEREWEILFRSNLIKNNVQTMHINRSSLPMLCRWLPFWHMEKKTADCSVNSLCILSHSIDTRFWLM